MPVNYSIVPEGHAVIDVFDRKELCILQITDLHSDTCENDNEQTRADIRAMVKQFHPDLLAVTGDVWCSDVQPETAPMWMGREIAFLGSLGVPWAFIPGNHDFIPDWANIRARIAGTPGGLSPQGDSHGSFRVEVVSGETTVWDLFFLNSGEAWNVPRDLDWFVAESQLLVAERGFKVPAVVFAHIPLGNFQPAISDGRAKGLALEETSGWGDDKNIGANVLREPETVRAFFCGHFHRNNSCFKENGILFVSSRSTGYGGYGHDTTPKGGTLIELDLASDTVRFQTVFADGSTWVP